MRLIDADALDKKLEVMKIRLMAQGRDTAAEDYNFVQTVLLTAHTVDAVEVVHGHWVSDKADILFHCSVCETQVSTDWDYDDLSWNYCPNCGAKMDLEV